MSFKEMLEELKTMATSACAYEFPIVSRDQGRALIELLSAAEEAESLRALCERLRLGAQIHAQEARTQRSIVLEIYQAVTGGKGEPGDWNGAKPVIEALESLRAQLAEYDKDWTKGFNAGREAVRRTNKSGCCCIIDDDNAEEVVSVCGAHKAWLEDQIAKVRNETFEACEEIAEEWGDYDILGGIRALKTEEK